MLRDLIDHGAETPKADCKTEIDTSTSEGKADLLKDISAISNTFGAEYNDYGFLIYGATRKAITGIKSTEIDSDKFQSHVEQLLKAYLSPMPQIYVIGFATPQGQHWGVIVIPPRNTKPHMFVRDIQCSTDPKRSRKRGEWFVRRGSNTDVGLPEDLAAIAQRQLDLMLEPLREGVRMLQLRVARTEEQYGNALFKLVERAASAPPQSGPQIPAEQSNLADAIGHTRALDLPTRLKRKLRKPANGLANELIAEAATLREYLDEGGTDLPWAPDPSDTDAPANRASIGALEERVRPILSSVAIVLLDDRDGEFTSALLRVVKTLARTSIPIGTRFNQIGPALRDYPLVLLLYAAFVCGTQTNNGRILRQLLRIPLRRREGHGNENILNIFRGARRANGLFNTSFGTAWCEPIAVRARQVLSDTVAEMLPGTPEPEYFFRGEFVLALSGVDRGITEKVTEEQLVPLPGLYLYLSEANEAIRDFLLERPDWLGNLYLNPVSDILRVFDKSWQRAVSIYCIGEYNLNASSVYESAPMSGT